MKNFISKISKDLSLIHIFSAISVYSMLTCGKRAVSTNRPPRPYTTTFLSRLWSCFPRAVCLPDVYKRQAVCLYYIRNDGFSVQQLFLLVRLVVFLSLIHIWSRVNVEQGADLPVMDTLVLFLLFLIQ